MRVFLEPDPCALSPERGPCTASITRYYYNVTTQLCQQFSYGGCFPNAKNFYILSMTVKTNVVVIQFVLLSIVPLKEEEHALCKINQSHNH